MTTPSCAVWAENADLVQAMHALAFNTELAAGTLDRAAFRHYMIQDALYLQGYARVLAIGAAKAPDADTILEFAQASQTAIVVERALHQGYLDQFGVSAADLESAEAAPACAAYVNFMLAEAATGSFASLVGAVLPCFWVYREIGLAIKAKGAPQNFYQAWIDTYADQAFGAATDRMIAIYDRCALAAGAPERVRMAANFRTCTRYEWMFWDGAYRRESWPI